MTMDDNFDPNRYNRYDDVGWGLPLVLLVAFIAFLGGLFFHTNHAGMTRTASTNVPPVQDRATAPTRPMAPSTVPRPIPPPQ